MRLFLLCGCLLHAAGAETAWHTISSVLLREPAEYLPTVPSHAAAAAIYSGVAHTFSGGYPFASYSVSMGSTSSAASDVDATVDPLSGLCNRSLHAAVLAGPLFTCPASGACSGPQLSTGALLCRASFHTPSVQLGGVVGTYWARAVASPAWAQFIFPAVPAGATTLTLRFTLDARYRPELYGGNPCANASAEYNCSLCTDGAWDFSQPAGFYALWSAAGRDDYVISGPHGGLELGLQFDAGILTHILEAPAALSLSPGEFPVVAFFIYSQYLAAGEVAHDDQGRCSVTWSGEYPGAPPYKGRPLMIEKATLLYRSGLAFPTQPPVGRPRLYGSNDVWYPSRVMPFFHAPCDAEAAPDAGWFEEAGVFDVKSHFEYAARGFRSCTQPAIDGADIAAYHPARKYLQYLDGGESPTFVDGRRALHLVRRLWSCYEQGGICEYNSSQALRLATALVAVEMARWESYVWTCGVQCGGTPGSVAFDLTTSEPVAYFSLWYDVLASQAGLVPAGNASVVASMLRSQIDLFRDAFWFGEWTLWNGNNWTPHLCTAALMWAIAFFHEDDAALEVVAMVNDIMWLHRKYYLPDGTYVEGVVVYSIMSISGLLQMASMQRPSFGAAPEAVDVDALRAVVRYQLASMATDGYAVDFGDSHSRRGWTETSTLDAAMASQIVLNVPAHARQPAIDACELRAHSASAYGSSSTGVDPWVLDPALLDLNISARVKSGCYDAHASRPLGGPRISLFPDGGYAAIRLPLLPQNRSGAPCFGSGAQQRCIDPSRPSLFDNVPYVHLSLQARSNSFAHSEVDFGTLVWSAWGSRLISDFGYGTIATAVGDWDTRRYEYIDNNPAGHSTVVVKEAFTSTGSRINFSQMNKGEAGSISLANVSRDDNSEASRCVELDGSVVYGSTRPDGWLDQMRRYACPLDAEAANPLFAGAILLIDVISVKHDREALSIFGSTYGGPNFNEVAPAGQQLHIEEYFYTDTAATLASDGDGNLMAEELPFNREALGSGGKWVRHVDVEVVSPHLVSLTPASGIGAYRDADGIGVVAGYATRGGNFTYDGVITSVNVWGEEHAYKKRRFRFVGDGPIDSDGDIRAFVLAPSAANQLSRPNVTLTSCGGALGCASNDAPVVCSCISICFGGDLHWTAVIDGKVKALRRVGNCSDDAADLLSPELVQELKDHVQLPTLAPTPTPTATPTTAPTAAPTASPTAAPTTASGGDYNFVSTIDFEALQASGENRLEVSWTRGAPSHAVSNVYWPAMQTASTCEGCSRGPLMLRQSGGLGLHLLSGGPSLYAYICWTQSAGVQFRQAQSDSGSSDLSTDDGSVICADSNSIKLLSECSVGYVQLGLGPDGTLHSANRSLGCVGVPGGSASASAGYSATLAFGPSFCIDGVDAAVWSLWANPYEPPGVSWTTRSASPSPQSSQGSTRWSIPLQIGLSENFRGGFGLEATAAGLSATNPSSGVQVVFPSGAYVSHAAWGGNTAFLFPTSSQSEYDSVGAALLSAWQSAFPSGSTIVFGPSPNATADACSVSENQRYTGFADAGSTSWCFTYANVDLDNYMNISLARGAVQLAMTPDAPDGSFISQMVVSGHALLSSLQITATTGAKRYRAISGSSARGEHHLRVVRQGIHVMHLLYQGLAWKEQSSSGELINAAVPLDSSGAHLEFTVWSDCVSVQLRPGAGTPVFDTSAINWTIGTHTPAEYGTTAAGAEAALRICMSDNGELPARSEDTASTVGEAQVHASVLLASIETAWDARKGEHRVVVPSSFPRCSYSSGCAPTHDIEVSAHGPPGSVLRLVLSRNFHEWASTSSRTGSEITGLSAVWYEDGQPSGRGVQISKNWHTQQGLNDPYQGYWWTFNSLVVLPTSGVWNGTCRVHYAGVVGGDATVSAAVVLAAASHGQLSLIGWGAFGLWEQVALGSGGEVMTYEPYGEQRVSMIDDMRPGPSMCGMVTLGNQCLIASDCASDKPFCLPAANSNGASTVDRCSPAPRLGWIPANGNTGVDLAACSSHTWTHNVGGGDFLTYFDEAGRFVPKGRELRSAILAPGPLLTKGRWTGKTLDAAMAWQVSSSTPATDDLTRHIYSLRVDVLNRTRPSRLAFFSLGADHYNDNRYNGFAMGGGHVPTANISVADISSTSTSRAYVSNYYRVPFVGQLPVWASLHEGTFKSACSDQTDTCSSGGKASRGLVVREYQARFGDEESRVPHISLMKQPGGSPTLELGLPKDITTLVEGDFMEALIEIIVAPVTHSMALNPASAVSGGNAAAASHPSLLADRLLTAERLRAPWIIVEHEAVANNLSVSIESNGAKLLRSYPVELLLQEERDIARLMIRGNSSSMIPLTLYGARIPLGWSLCWKNEIDVSWERFPTDPQVVFEADTSDYSFTWLFRLPTTGSLDLVWHLELSCPEVTSPPPQPSAPTFLSPESPPAQPPPLSPTPFSPFPSRPSPMHPPQASPSPTPTCPPPSSPPSPPPALPPAQPTPQSPPPISPPLLRPSPMPPPQASPGSPPMVPPPTPKSPLPRAPTSPPPASPQVLLAPLSPPPRPVSPPPSRPPPMHPPPSPTPTCPPPSSPPSPPPAGTPAQPTLSPSPTSPPPLRPSPMPPPQASPSSPLSPPMVPPPTPKSSPPPSPPPPPPASPHVLLAPLSPSPCPVSPPPSRPSPMPPSPALPSPTPTCPPPSSPPSPPKAVPPAQPTLSPPPCPVLPQPSRPSPMPPSPALPSPTPTCPPLSSPPSPPTALPPAQPTLSPSPISPPPLRPSPMPPPQASPSSPLSPPMVPPPTPKSPPPPSPPPPPPASPHVLLAPLSPPPCPVSPPPSRPSPMPPSPALPSPTTTCPPPSSSPSPPTALPPAQPTLSPPPCPVLPPPLRPSPMPPPQASSPPPLSPPMAPPTPKSPTPSAPQSPPPASTPAQPPPLSPPPCPVSPPPSRPSPMPPPQTLPSTALSPPYPTPTTPPPSAPPPYPASPPVQRAPPLSPPPSGSFPAPPQKPLFPPQSPPNVSPATLTSPFLPPSSPLPLAPGSVLIPVIVATFEIDSTLETFDRSSFLLALSSLLNVSLDRLDVNVVSGSVLVTVTIRTVSSTSVSGSQANLTTIAETLRATDTATLSSRLNVNLLGSPLVSSVNLVVPGPSSPPQLSCPPPNAYPPPAWLPSPSAAASSPPLLPQLLPPQPASPSAPDGLSFPVLITLILSFSLVSLVLCGCCLWSKRPHRLFGERKSKVATDAYALTDDNGASWSPQSGKDNVASTVKTIVVCGRKESWSSLACNDDEHTSEGSAPVCHSSNMEASYITSTSAASHIEMKDRTHAAISEVENEFMSTRTSTLEDGGIGTSVEEMICAGPSIRTLVEDYTSMDESSENHAAAKRGNPSMQVETTVSRAQTKKPGPEHTGEAEQKAAHEPRPDQPTSLVDDTLGWHRSRMVPDCSDFSSTHASSDRFTREHVMSHLISARLHAKDINACLPRLSNDNGESKIVLHRADI